MGRKGGLKSLFAARWARLASLERLIDKELWSVVEFRREGKFNGKSGMPARDLFPGSILRDRKEPTEEE